MHRVSALVLFLVLSGSALGQVERNHDITPEDYASVNTITEIAVSPDGKQVAYCLATWDKKADNRRTDLWVVATDGKGKPRQLTKDRANDRQPKWSADGKAIFVLGNRKTKDDKKAITRVWKVWLDEERPPTAVTNERDAVTGYDYAPKADRIFFTFDATATDEDHFSALRKKFDKPKYGSGKRTVSELYVLNAENIPEKLIAEKRYIREFAVTADGKRIAMITAFDDTVLKSEGESRVDVWEGNPEKPETPGKIVTPPTDVYRAKAASPYAWLESIAWNPDGTRFAFCAIFDAYPAEIIIGELKDEKWTTSEMTRSSETQVRGYGSPLKWMTNDFLAYLDDRQGKVRSRTYVFPQRRTHELLDNFHIDGVVYAIDVPSESPRVEVAGTLDRIAVLSALTDKGWILLVDPNPHTSTWKLPSVQHITWSAPDGTEVGGPLELPYGWKKGDKPLPLVVAIHGGPTTANYNDLRFDPHNGRLFFAAHGYAVLCPNYRGSTGYGDKFVTDLIGHENDIEVKDIL
ncbi:MAG TPA: LpqB family beta-propeller domain-containing protein, partial [Gemmata sp.]|nr:LpqB family beta-propeller domain-containing protein [Gemmata sp.]